MIDLILNTNQVFWHLLHGGHSYLRIMPWNDKINFKYSFT